MTEEGRKEDTDPTPTFVVNAKMEGCIDIYSLLIFVTCREETSIRALGSPHSPHSSLFIPHHTTRQSL